MRACQCIAAKSSRLCRLRVSTAVVSGIPALGPLLLSYQTLMALHRHVAFVPISGREQVQQTKTYSIIWSARASNAGGTSSPSALAALILITVSYLIGFCTGRSAGKHTRRYFQAECFGSLDVEHGLVFRRSLHREVGWFLA